MTNDDFQNSIVTPMVADVKTIFATKGEDYAGEGDRLSNFKRIGLRLAMSPKMVCLVYIMKHLDALITDASTGQVKGEPVSDKLKDIVAYAMLYAGLDKEEKELKEIPF